MPIIRAAVPSHLPKAISERPTSFSGPNPTCGMRRGLRTPWVAPVTSHAKIVEEQSSLECESAPAACAHDDAPHGVLRCVQNATLFVPNVAVRFDYSQVTAAGATQFVSLFYSDRPATTNPTVTSNLKQGYGVSPLLRKNLTF